MRLVLGNIVDMAADAIVIPAHSDLRPMPGISQAVFDAADTKQLRAFCADAGRCRIGSSVITPSCGLPCRYIIHTAGPDWYSGQRRERLLFADCCRQALNKAYLHHCRTAAVPLMFSGEYHIPRAQALQIMCRVILAFERTHPSPEVWLVLYKAGIYHLAETICARLSQEGGQKAPMRL